MSDDKGRCMDCGAEFLITDPETRVGDTFGFCSQECYDAYLASLR